MTRPWPVVALAVIVAVNLAMLSGVWRARRGEPDALLHLDERELPLVQGEGDSSVRVLRLAMQPITWAEPRSIADLGFPGIAPLSPRELPTLRGVLPRPAFVVCEFDGPAWRERRQRWRSRVEIDERRSPHESGDHRAAGMFDRASRLVQIDAGLDAESLRAQYPDRSRYLVLPVVVGLRIPRAGMAGPGAAVSARVIMVLPDQILVPTRWRHVFAGLAPARPGPSPGRQDVEPPDPLPTIEDEPRYDVTLATDASLQPYVVEARRLR